MEVIGAIKADTLLFTDNNFIGTLNNVPLNFRAGGIAVGRLEFDDVTGNMGQGMGLGNVFFGFRAGLNNSTGKRNVAAGTHALMLNTSGRANTAVGASALESNTTGDFNAAIGEKTLSDNTTGIRNVALGNEALFSNIAGNENIGIGIGALAANLSGSNNIGIGYTACFGNITGNNNIAIGRNALVSNSSGSSNTALGYEANVGADGLTNATAIGANAIVSASNSLVLGNGANVGIGTSAPVQRLEVAGTIYSTTGGFKFPDGSVQTSAGIQQNSSATFSSVQVNSLSGTGDRVVGADENGNLKVFAFTPTSASWQTNGNGGTNPFTDFLGTTDAMDLVIKTDANGGGGERMRIMANGNVRFLTGGGNVIIKTDFGEGGAAEAKVGIGTENPVRALHIHTEHFPDFPPPPCPNNDPNCVPVVGSHMGLRLDDITQIGNNNPLRTIWDIAPISGNLFVGKGNTMDESIDAKMTILGNGNVGIGITNPGAPLEVHGSVSIYDGNANTSLFFGRDQVSDKTFGKWGIQYVPSGSLAPQAKGGLNFWIPLAPGNNFGNNFLFLADDGKIGIKTNNPQVDLHINGEIAISGSRLNIDPVTGNVAIASTLRIGPQVAIAPFNNYRLSVDGSIVAKEVHINLNTWADHVFDKKYNLLPLPELEKFIRENKHLPDMPNEKQVLEKGIDLGEMNSMLLKKIEELTLYMIEMKKELEKQKQQIAGVETNKK